VCENIPIVLVAAKDDVLNNIRDLLLDTKLKLLCAKTKDEAISLLGRIKSTIGLAILKLDQPEFADNSQKDPRSSDNHRHDIVLTLSPVLGNVRKARCRHATF
jgi:hypothetical protein